MNPGRLLRLVTRHLEGLDVSWALAGGFALNALGYARLTKDIDLLVDEAGRGPLVQGLTADGFETLFTSEGYLNLLHPDPELGRLDLIWVEGETSRRIFAGCQPVTGPDSLPVLVPRPEHLAAMKVAAVVAFRATPAESSALARNRPGPMTFEEYAGFLEGFRWSSEELRAIPGTRGPRFTLD